MWIAAGAPGTCVWGSLSWGFRGLRHFHEVHLSESAKPVTPNGRRYPDRECDAPADAVFRRHFVGEGQPTKHNEWPDERTGLPFWPAGINPQLGLSKVRCGAGVPLQQLHFPLDLARYPRYRNSPIANRPARKSWHCAFVEHSRVRQHQEIPGGRLTLAGKRANHGCT